MPRMTGSRLVAEVFKSYGVTHVFFVPTILMDALAEMDDLGVQKILTHGEKAAVYMADGYARAKGGPGVCLAQQIGASNLAAGLRDPFMAHTPLIAITGGPGTPGRYRHAYQEVEDFSQFDSVTKLNMTLDDISRLPDLLNQMFRAATTGAPGPVHMRVRGSHGQGIEGESDIIGRLDAALFGEAQGRIVVTIRSDGSAGARLAELANAAGVPATRLGRTVWGDTFQFGPIDSHLAALLEAYEALLQ